VTTIGSVDREVRDAVRGDRHPQSLRFRCRCSIRRVPRCSKPASPPIARVLLAGARECRHRVAAAFIEAKTGWRWV
jgi:hypothetical protein